MKDLFETKQDLIKQISSFKQRIKNLERLESERRKAEEGLLYSRDMLQTVLDSIPSGVFWKDRDSIYLGGNRYWLETVGIKSLEEIVGKSDYDLPWSKEQADSFRKYDKRIMESGIPEYNIVEPYLRADGAPAWARTNKVPLRDEEGNVAGILGTYEDITARQQLESKERQSREAAERLAEEMSAIAETGRVIGSSLNIAEVYERFAAEVKKLIPSDRVSVSLINPDGKSFTIAYLSGVHITYRRSGAIIPIAGSVSEIFIRRQSGLIIHAEDPEDFLRQFPGVTDFAIIQAGIRSMIGIPLISRDRVIGNLLFLSKKSNAYTEQDLRLAERIGDQIAGAIANAQLFADLKKTEMSLRESELRFRTLVEEAPVGVADVEIGPGRFFMVNRRLCEMMGRSEEEMLDTTFMAITHPEDLHLHEEKRALLLAGKIRRYSLEKRYLRKDGETVWANITVSPLWKTGEAPVRRITVVEDITERKRVEEVLQRAHAELESKNSTLEELNTALKVLLKQREDDKKDLEERFVMNVQSLVLPFVEQMKKGRLDAGQRSCLEIVETHLRHIAAPLLKSMRQFNLTPQELKVAALVRDGRTTKEIAEILNVATGSIDIHRNNIRKKLGLNTRKTNLQSHLESLL